MTTTQQHESPFPIVTHPFDRQAAVVTGSTNGIGHAIARLLAARGAHVIVSGRDEARGSAVVKEIRADGDKADFVAANLRTRRERGPGLRRTRPPPRAAGWTFW